MRALPAGAWNFITAPCPHYGGAGWAVSALPALQGALMLWTDCTAVPWPVWVSSGRTLNDGGLVSRAPRPCFQFVCSRTLPAGPATRDASAWRRQCSYAQWNELNSNLGFLAELVPILGGGATAPQCPPWLRLCVDHPTELAHVLIISVPVPALEPCATSPGTGEKSTRGRRRSTAIEQLRWLLELRNYRNCTTLRVECVWKILHGDDFKGSGIVWQPGDDVL